jgi:ferritin-like metal-binding protein YciE
MAGAHRTRDPDERQARDFRQPAHAPGVAAGQMQGSAPASAGQNAGLRPWRSNWYAGCAHAPMASKLNNLQELLVHELKDLYSAETQLVKALPRMAKAATDETLKAGFESHLEETEEHVSRLERALKALGESPRGKTCKAMKGLIEEGKETIEEKAVPDVKDAALIVAAQKIEHYEIAGYGSARTFAELLELDNVVKLLDETLNEEKAADEKLTEAATSINLAAETADTDD